MHEYLIEHEADFDKEFSAISYICRTYEFKEDLMKEGLMEKIEIDKIKKSMLLN